MRGATCAVLRRAMTIGFVTLAVVLAADRAALAQCAMCRLALQSPEGQRMLGAFQGGILFLLAAPFAVFGVIATLAIRRHRLLSEALPDAAGFSAPPELARTGVPFADSPLPSCAKSL